MLTEAEIKKRVADYYENTTPEEQAEMRVRQRESFIRAMGPCEHGEYDWETCPKCLSPATQGKDK